MPGGQNPLEVRVWQRRVVGQPPPEHERIPLLFHHQRPTAGIGSAFKKVSAPEIPVGPHVKAGHFIRRRHVQDVFAGVCGVAKAEGVDVVIAHRQPGFSSRREILEQWLDEDGIRNRIHMRDRILEAEIKGARIQAKGFQDLALSGPVETVDHGDAAVWFRPQSVPHPLSVGCPQPLLLHPGVHLVRHSLACRNAHARQ